MKTLLVVCAVLAIAVLAAGAAPPAAKPAPPAAKPAPLAASPAPPAPAKETCVTCHLDMGDDRLIAPIKAYAGDIHSAKGIGCTGCHGGDPAAEGMDAMDPATGFIGKPERGQLTQVCGRCHSDARFMKQYNPSLRVDQVAEYETSVHGRRLRENKDAKVAVCISCHPAHSIKPPSDPASSVHPLHVAETCARCHGDATYMAGRKVPTDQLKKYLTSVHWKAMSVKGDLSAPTCNKCHGNHGAAPPGVTWVGNVCGQCHAVMGELFAKSVHASAFARLGAPGCATCHDNHGIQPASVEMVGVGAGAVCVRCHKPDDPAGKAAADIRAQLDTLRTEYTRVGAALTQAERAGLEVSQVRFDLNSANDALVKARAAVHSASAAAVRQETDAGLAIVAKASTRAQRALDEGRFRRKGLAASLVVILVVIGGLVAWIRDIDRQRRREEETR